MDAEHHFLCPKKLQKFLKLCNKNMVTKMDNEVVKNLQLLIEKFLSDIIHRSALLCKHKGKSIIEKSEIQLIIEKDFDYSFGAREIQGSSNVPSNEHTEKMAEISRQSK
ncbi:hypothetical protein HK407_02g04430 [Ordospora pajunii]|jgi:histone H3/H4|uniref:uncharacterized protein n=1 Tax=Ordospora pajunii TaxID=3039483 RepID=UPI0029526DCE|nr:uncharacterized protein HK407_02g04430 [Ordospora pajunii]KAH9411995.1 hypothetical protein HK407_02g04430 [Ordospora pajunii]